MKASTGHKNIGRSRQSGARRISRQVLPALLVAGSGLCASSASALELGEIIVESKLGQPLSASIAYALNPNEQIFDYCISLRPGTMASGIPSISKARISVTAGAIVFTGALPIREPVLGMRVTVNCPYTAQLAREYTLMIDPGLPAGRQQMVAIADPVAQPTLLAPVAEAQAVAAAPTVSSAPAVASAPAPTPAPVQTSTPAAAAVAAQVDQSPITINSQYFVLPGDSLYAIATRIENRPVGLRHAANAIFSANPGAFTENDVNLLTAGIWITIPDFAGTGIVANPAVTTGTRYVANDSADSDEPASFAVEETANNTYSGISAVETPAEVAAVTAPVAEEPVAEIAPVAAVVETAVVEEPVVIPVADVPAAAIQETVAEPAAEPIVAETPAVDTEPAGTDYFAENTDDLRPGDVVVNGDTALPAPDNVATDSADVAATAAAAAPVVSLANGDANAGIGSWLIWLGGAGLGVLLGLVLFYRRRIKEYFGSDPISDPTEQLDDDLTDEVEIISDFDPVIADAGEEPSIVADVDFQLDDSMISSQSISLDADLDAGTGLQNVSDVDVAQDFGFSASSINEAADAIDLELPEEAPQEPENLPTDIIPPNHKIEDSILDSEEPPSIDASAEYDMSMIVDATKQALGGDDLTAKDLMAVQIGGVVENEADGNELTLNKKVDIQALEQDYQDEYTATLAMNEEIEQAAIDLALRLDESDPGELTSELPSVAEAMQAEAVLEDDMATEIASLDDEIDDLADTGVNPQLTAKMLQPGADKTVEMPHPGAEPTVEMPNPGNEPTVEMQIESGTVDTKKSQAS